MCVCVCVRVIIVIALVKRRAGTQMITAYIAYEKSLSRRLFNREARVGLYQRVRVRNVLVYTKS